MANPISKWVRCRGVPGIPLQVVNYDIYPKGEATTTTLLAAAILEAVKDYRLTPKEAPGVI